MINRNSSKIFLILVVFTSVSCKKLQSISTATAPIIPILTWVKQFGAFTTLFPGGTAGDDECYSSAIDSNGNIYCAGTTTSSFGEAYGGGGSDAFIMKTDSAGNVIWIKQFGAVTSAGGDNTAYDYCSSVAVDNNGNVYCAGSTTGSFAEPNGGSYDAFVVKLDFDGNLVWAKQLGATTVVPGNTAGDDWCSSVSVDSSGFVYCTGNTSGDLGEVNGGGYDTFAMKLDSSGTLIWLTQIGSVTAPLGAAGDDFCYSGAVDPAGNVLCSGDTDGDLGENNGGLTDAFIAKFDSTGGLTWITQLGGTTVVPGGDTAGADTCYSVTSDIIGNIFCAGYTTGALGEANGGNNDIFIVKLDLNGSLLFTKQLGATTIPTGGDTAGNDMANAISVDIFGNIYCSGYTDGSLGEPFGGGSSDAFLMVMDTSGNLTWLTQLGGTTTLPLGGSSAGDDICYSVLYDADGSVYCGGFTGGNLGELNGGSFDNFIVKLNSGGRF